MKINHYFLFKLIFVLYFWPISFSKIPILRGTSNQARNYLGLITETDSSWKPRWLEGAFWGSCLGWLLAMSSTETRLDTWPQYSNSLPPARGFQSTSIVLKVVFVAAKFVDRSGEWTQSSNINRFFVVQVFSSFSINFQKYYDFIIIIIW